MLRSTYVNVVDETMFCWGFEIYWFGPKLGTIQGMKLQTSNDISSRIKQRFHGIERCDELNTKL
jgi:hypothetical protein